jgi:hypothetical protein
MASRKKADKKPSPYTILNHWLFDNNRNSEIPQELIDDKSIGPQYVLYFFQGSSYQRFISELFNNYSVYQLDRIEMFKMIKEAARLSGFRPRFIKRFSESKTKLTKALKKKYPYLKYEDVSYLADQIDECDEQESIYEMLNLKAPRKYKTKKETLKQVKELKNQPKEELKVESSAYGWKDLLDNFTLQEL